MQEASENLHVSTNPPQIYTKTIEKLDPKVSHTKKRRSGRKTQTRKQKKTKKNFIYPQSYQEATETNKKQRVERVSP